MNAPLSLPDRPLSRLRWPAAALLLCIAWWPALVCASDGPVFVNDAATMGEGALAARLSFDYGTLPSVHHHGLVGSTLAVDYGALSRLQAGMRLSYSRNPQVICGSGAGCFNTEVAALGSALRLQLLRAGADTVQLGLELDGSAQNLLNSGSYLSIAALIAGSLRVRPLHSLLYVKVGYLHKRALDYLWSRDQPVAVFGVEGSFGVLGLRLNPFLQGSLSMRVVNLLQTDSSVRRIGRTEAGLVTGLGVCF